MYLRKHRQALSERLPCVLYKRYYHELMQTSQQLPEVGSVLNLILDILFFFFLDVGDF